MITQLSPRFTSRSVRSGDNPALVELFNTYSQSLVGFNMDTESELESAFRAEGFNVETNTHVICLPNGKIIAYAEIWDILKPYVYFPVWGCVHPDHYGQGIGQHLIEWIEHRSRECMVKAPADAKVLIRHPLFKENQAARDLLSKNGFVHVRTFYQMQIEFTTQPPAPVLPEGITIRPILGEEEHIAVLRTIQNSFRDHWGHVDEPLEDYIKRFLNYIQSDDGYDPAIWFLALENDEPIGACICRPNTIQDPKMGWVNSLGVIRPWRKTGIGLALLLTSFNEFFRRGYQKVGLGVDADSLTGATRLYEKAGMEVTRETLSYEKVLRPGKDYTTVQISD